jgi:glutathione S-transferase
MALVLYAHPFASYCWKALIALYENETPFAYRVVDNAAAFAELEALWPLKKFPVLKDGDDVVLESSVIVEYLARRRPGPARLIPEGVEDALEARFLDRFFDNYVHTPMQKLVLDHLRAEGERDPAGVADAKALLDQAYAWLDTRIVRTGWAAGGEFTLADCSAAPALFYADWVHPIGARFPGVSAYRARLLARPSVARTVDEARPYRKLVPARRSGPGLKNNPVLWRKRHKPCELRLTTYERGS